ncbi:MAG: hypothetical protein Q4D23_06115 [Bacteroidales bacterium]|nr:hypothetical protein [Bacteroidales bacterium]
MQKYIAPALELVTLHTEQEAALGLGSVSTKPQLSNALHLFDDEWDDDEEDEF